jgi:hypothetical protein
MKRHGSFGVRWMIAENLKNGVPIKAGMQRIT